MEGGALHSGGADTSAFRDCFTLASSNPFVLRLAFSAGIGGLLFGYDTGVISGALLYIRDDFSSVDTKTVLQESIVSMAVAGAIIGAAHRRLAKRQIRAAERSPRCRLPLLHRSHSDGCSPKSCHPDKASPAKIRGALVSTNGFLITGGQLLSYLINLAFTKAPGTWRWMLGVAGLPALLQFILMLLLPESPRWLYRKGREAEAEAILKRIYSPEQVCVEMQNLKESIEKEAVENSSSEKISMVKLLRTTTVRRGLVAGVGLQVFQQFVGINTVMDERVWLHHQRIYFIDRTGRKKLIIISLCGVVVSLGLLSAVFHETASHSPAVSAAETSSFAPYTCPDYRSAGAAPLWNCMKCLKADSPSCGFCGSSKDKMLPGACLLSNNTVRDNVCNGEGKAWYTRGCPSSFGWLALVGLSLYILFFSPGMGTVPWIVNSEIYPLRFRGICGGIAATANWISNLIVAQFFLSLTEAISTSWTFLLFGIVSVVALLFVLVCVPETKGLPIEEVEKMLEGRAIQLKFWERRSDLPKQNLQI
ncbi:Fibroblast growth factor 3 [Salvia divinorum]|uniref:Fibroblast growth factor 3 n=1 Tax=Salvia divinorum TaxID=28513 RepID=A0ABD1HWA5_SALDI